MCNNIFASLSTAKAWSIYGFVSFLFSWSVLGFFAWCVDFFFLFVCFVVVVSDAIISTSF